MNGDLVRFVAGRSSAWYDTVRRARTICFVPFLRMGSYARTAPARSPCPRCRPSTCSPSIATTSTGATSCYDNLVARVQTEPALGPLRSYSTVRRDMRVHGGLRKRRAAATGRPGEARRGGRFPRPGWLCHRSGQLGHCAQPPDASTGRTFELDPRTLWSSYTGLLWRNSDSSQSVSSTSQCPSRSATRRGHIGRLVLDAARRHRG